MLIQSCPFLPEPTRLGHRVLGRHGLRRDAAFYFDALRYGHALWLQGHAGRAILALTRALYAELDADDPVLKQWPLPYASLYWILCEHPSDDFPGNPRISFQHQATRVSGHRREVRSSRAWAVWALARAAKPSLAGDSKQAIAEPELEDIATLLTHYGHPDEARRWQNVFCAEMI